MSDRSSFKSINEPALAWIFSTALAGTGGKARDRTSSYDLGAAGEVNREGRRSMPAPVLAMDLRSENEVHYWNPELRLASPDGFRDTEPGEANELSGVDPVEEGNPDAWLPVNEVERKE